MLTKDEILALKTGDFLEETDKSASGVVLKISRVEAVYFTDLDINGRLFVEVQVLDEDNELNTLKLRENNTKYRIIPTALKGRRPGKKKPTNAGHVT